MFNLFKKDNKEILLKTFSKEDIQKREEIISNLVLNGDIKKLNNIQRVEYYTMLCESLNLNPLTKPFDIIDFPKSNKTVLYPNKDCAEQLRKKDGVSIYKTEEVFDKDLGIIKIKAYAVNKYGTKDVAIASLPLIKQEKKWDTQKQRYIPTGKDIQLNPQELSDALMKCDTKAKRRVTFSICGLGMPHEEDFQYHDNEIDEDKTEVILEDVKQKAIEEKKVEKKEEKIKREKKKENNQWQGLEKKEIKGKEQKEEILAMARLKTEQIKTDGKVQYFIDLSKGKDDYSQDQYLLDLQYLQGLEKEPKFNDEHMQEKENIDRQFHKTTNKIIKELQKDYP